MRRLAAGFRNLKIAHKLLVLIVLINLTALSIGGAFFSFHIKHTLRDDTVSLLKLRAEIVAISNLTGALSFKDKNAAQDALTALATDKYTRAAAVYDRQGALFAVYPVMTIELEKAANMLRQDYLFLGNELFIKQPVILDNENLGFLVLQYDLQGINNKYWKTLCALIALFSGVVLLTYLLTLALHSHITKPIEALSQLTLNITQEKDYSIRASPWGKDEIGELTLHVNQMLEQIQNRDAKLEQYNKELEQMVVKRTAQLEELNRNLMHRARHDALTDLPNRAVFNDRLQQAIFAADRNKTKTAILFVDLDYFKQINDTYGHEAGDQVLMQVAKRMGACLRNVDTLSRFAGDEFTLLLPTIKTSEDVSRVAAKLIQEFAKPVMIKTLSLDISASIGAAIYPDDAVELESLLQAADVAMYQAKKMGRNCFQLYSGGMSELPAKRQELQADLKNAISNDEIVIMYQPVIDLATGKLDSLEALLRWRHPQLGMFAADDFLPVAKDSGLISGIDKHMLLNVSSQLRAWHDKGLALPVRINLTMRDFLSADFFELFFQLIDNGAIDPMLLSVEIEESVLRNESPRIVGWLNRLKDSPFSITIDNFGTEYMSLVSLLRGRIQYVKIDRSYFQNSANNEQFRIIQALIVAMAHNLNVKAIAVGVETTAQREFLENIGCDLAQGYLFHKPLFYWQVEELLAGQQSEHGNSSKGAAAGQT